MTESYRDRLRRLRRDESPAAEKPAAGTSREGARKGMPSWLRERLDRQRERGPDGADGPGRTAAHPGGSSAGARTGGPRDAAHLRPRSTGEPRDLDARTRAEGAFAERVQLRPDSDVHGTWSLDRVDAVDGGEVFARLARDPALAGLDPRRAVYLDIETTGLSGGAGTWPFLIALGRYTEDGSFELWQGFLRDPAEERAMLAEVAERVAAADAVVSFFGKSFDRHRLEDKLRQHRLSSPFEGRPHLDLYHPLNRLYCRRSHWERLAGGGGPAPTEAGYRDGRLSTMEAGLCGLERIDDLSGAHAPAAWFDFLAGRPHLLEAVFDHNADDVWSLATLTAHLGRSLSETDPGGGDLSGPFLARALGLASIFRDESDRPAERIWLERARERLAAIRATPLEPVGLTVWRADAARLAGDKAAALELYDELVRRPDRHTPRLQVERAKLLEHHAKDPAAALAACEAGNESVPRWAERTCLETVAWLMVGMPSLPAAQGEVSAVCRAWPAGWQGLCQSLASRQPAEPGTPSCEDEYVARFVPRIPARHQLVYQQCAFTDLLVDQLDLMGIAGLNRHQASILPSCLIGAARALDGLECSWSGADLALYPR